MSLLHPGNKGTNHKTACVWRRGWSYVGSREGAGFNEGTSGCRCLCICSAWLPFGVCLVMKSCSWVLFTNDSRNGNLIPCSATSRVRRLYATNAEQTSEETTPSSSIHSSLVSPFEFLIFLLVSFSHSYKSRGKSLRSFADQFRGVLLYWRFPQLEQITHRQN